MAVGLRVIVDANSSVTVYDLPAARPRFTLIKRAGIFTGDYIEDVALSSDAKWLAYAWHNQVTILNTTTGATSSVLKSEEALLCIAFSVDAKTLVAGTYHGKVMVWNVATTHLVRSFQAHADSIEAIALSPDGYTLATGGQDNEAKLWETETGHIIHTLSGHAGAIQVIAFAPDGTLLATGSTDKTAKLWTVPEGKEYRSFSTLGRGVYCIAFSSDSHLLAVGTRGFQTSPAQIAMWHISDNLRKRELELPHSNIRSLSFINNSYNLLYADDNTISVMRNAWSGN